MLVELSSYCVARTNPMTSNNLSSVSQMAYHAGSVGAVSLIVITETKRAGAV